MPKEKVAQTVYENKEDNSHTTEFETIEVAWIPGQFAELRISRTYTRDGESDPDIDDVEIGMMLSREDINNCIRVLRRARDKAFGKDA